jgi:hypothetical protein
MASIVEEDAAKAKREAELEQKVAQGVAASPSRKKASVTLAERKSAGTLADIQAVLGGQLARTPQSAGTLADIQGELQANATRPPEDYDAGPRAAVLLRLALATAMNPRLGRDSPAADLPGDVIIELANLATRCHMGSIQEAELRDSGGPRRNDRQSTAAGRRYSRSQQIARRNEARGYLPLDHATVLNARYGADKAFEWKYKNYKRQYEILLDDMYSRCRPTSNRPRQYLERFLKEFFVMFIVPTNLEKIENGETTLIKIFYETPYECPDIKAWVSTYSLALVPIWSIKLCAEFIWGGDNERWWFNKWLNQLKSYHAAYGLRLQPLQETAVKEADLAEEWPSL